MLLPMTTIDLADATALLARTPATFDALLRGLPDTWTQRGEGDGTWTAVDVVGHLIFGEITDWMPRVQIILARGEERAFEPFDMRGHEGVVRGKSLGDLLDELVRRRSQRLDELKALNLTPRQLELRGMHPELGSVTLSQLIAAWAAHDLTHLHQLTRVLAHQYREAAGPWRKYMGVMHCGGHSAK